MIFSRGFLPRLFPKTSFIEQLLTPSFPRNDRRSTRHCCQSPRLSEGSRESQLRNQNLGRSRGTSLFPFPLPLPPPFPNPYLNQHSSAGAEKSFLLLLRRVIQLSKQGPNATPQWLIPPRQRGLKYRFVCWLVRMSRWRMSRSLKRI